MWNVLLWGVASQSIGATGRTQDPGVVNTPVYSSSIQIEHPSHSFGECHTLSSPRILNIALRA